MIEALYEIGKIVPEQNFLEEYIDDIGNKIKHVFKIILDISDPENFQYVGIEYEEYDPNKKLKYFYKKGSPNGPNKTPTAKITQLEKTFKTKIKPIFKNLIKEHKEHINEESFNLLLNIKSIFEKYNDKIINDLKKFIIDNKFLKNEKGEIKEGGLITFAFKKNGKLLYIGDLSLFQNMFKNNEKEAYRKFYNKYGEVSLAYNKYCYICKKKKGEVWGFVSTFNFYTVDKEGMVTGGFKQKYAWKNYPVCSDCAIILERGKRFIKKNLNYNFCGFNYLLIPQLIVSDSNLLSQIVGNLINRYESFSLERKKSSRIEKVEEKTLEILAEEENIVLFNFLFYEEKQSGNVFNILLELNEIPPSRLNRLIKAKEVVDNEEKKNYKIFTPIVQKVGKEEIDFDFSFKFIRDFFPNKKNVGNFDKSFLSIVNNIFINKKIEYNFLIKQFMKIIRSEFLQNKMYIVSVLKGYKILLYLYELGLLDKKIVIKNEESFMDVYEDFFKESTILNEPTKKAVFLEGVLANFLLDIQFQEKQSKPFQSRLNGLKIDAKIVKRLLPEIINKLEEYNKNYYRDLEESISKYLIKSDFSKYTVDELSFYFVLGMTLSRLFKKDQESYNED